jgi:hypothetical protein
MTDFGLGLLAGLAIGVPIGAAFLALIHAGCEHLVKLKGRQ